MAFEEFPDDHHDGHLGYRNETLLAILNLYGALMPPIKFRLNRLTVLEDLSSEEFQDDRHGGHLGYRNRTIFSNSEYLCCHNVSD